MTTKYGCTPDECSPRCPHDKGKPRLPDLEVRGLDEKYKIAWYRLPFWKAIGTALRYCCAVRIAR